MYLFPSHLAAGYLSAYAINRHIIKDNKILYNTVLFTSLIPDIDGLFLKQLQAIIAFFIRQVYGLLS